MTTNVLILCTHNSVRSVLAEAMPNHYADRLGVNVRAYSAGSAPSGRINPLALAVLADAGVSTGGVRSKRWDETARRAAFDLTRQAIGYRMLQLLRLPIASMDDAAMRRALLEISRS